MIARIGFGPHTGAALVCPVCTRDLYLFKPLLHRIEELEKQVQANPGQRTEALETRLTALESELAQWRGGMFPGVQFESQSARAEPGSLVAGALSGCAVLIALLLIAHTLIIIVHDLKPLFLRLASLLIPLPIGFALYLRHPGRGWALALLAAVAACAAVLGMSAITGHVDNTPVLPRDPRELRELIEYAVSIAFSFLTGMLLGKLRRQRLYGGPAPNRVLILVAKLLATDEQGQLGLQKVVTRAAQISAAAAPAVSGAVSIYTGIKAVIGDS